MLTRRQWSSYERYRQVGTDLVYGRNSLKRQTTFTMITPKVERPTESAGRSRGTSLTLTLLGYDVLLPATVSNIVNTSQHGVMRRRALTVHPRVVFQAALEESPYRRRVFDSLRSALVQHLRLGRTSHLLLAIDESSLLVTTKH